MLFSEPKIPQLMRVLGRIEDEHDVSVLFSKPKIPQFQRGCKLHCLLHRFQCSSASRKFLNADARQRSQPAAAAFQCSSASRKFLNAVTTPYKKKREEFQCSSASRKFLNGTGAAHQRGAVEAFQCSSASRKFLNSDRLRRAGDDRRVSVLFSEPKIPQCS